MPTPEESFITSDPDLPPRLHLQNAGSRRWTCPKFPHPVVATTATMTAVTRGRLRQWLVVVASSAGGQWFKLGGRTRQSRHKEWKFEQLTVKR
ncbi:uncharacterized protein A4U43_C05F20420 [Asparagus officinalis]|uniref:Uncharacterized protein n=1 Tax=Asparagus officinalis TaxID=4686 RepID=A0A5P1EU60_ASPOF|nr:uncharacterized protein A4U43_C05F20420 [Asparagus officinalis]